MMDADTQEHFRCGDCNRVFEKRMDYKYASRELRCKEGLNMKSCSRHRKRHDKPFPCSLCQQRFGLKTDLARHRQTHLYRYDVQNFKCKFPGCNFRGSSRKDYLWKHLQKKHQDCQRMSPNKTLRQYYEEFAREGQTLDNQQDLELLEAANTGDVEKVRDLLAREANISVKDKTCRTPLELAVCANHTAVVKLLCDHGADPRSAVYSAASSGNEDAIEMLIGIGVDIDINYALFISAQNGNEKMARFLLEKGAYTNYTNYWKETPLHIAVQKSEGITRALLDANADVNAKIVQGETPLSYAIGIQWPWFKFNEATTKLLLEAGATVEQRHWDKMPRWFREQNGKYAPTPNPPPSPDWATMLQPQRPT